MTIHQVNKRAMFGNVAAVINRHIVLFAGLSAFATAFEKFQNLLEHIDTTANEKAGEFMMRDASEETLINIMVEVASALCAYAGKAKLAEVKSMATVKRSELEHMPLTELGQKAKSILKFAARYADHLVAYGADANKVAKLNAALPKFLAAAATCKSGIAGQSNAAGSLRDMFQEADMVLSEQLDRMVESLKRKHHDFYHEYHTARVICTTSDARSKEEAVAVTAAAV